MFFLFFTALVLPSVIPQFNYFQINVQRDSTCSSIIKQNLSKLEPGDIAFKHPDIFPDFFPTIIDHCLIFIKYDNKTGLYVFIEASMVDSKVQYKYETESELIGPFYGPFAKVRHANETQKQNAIDFAKKQLGKSFQGEWINKNYNPEDTKNDPYANEWYCSELLWAAYYNCNHPFPEKKPVDGYVYGEGIDLDRNGWKKNLLNYSIVAPREILYNPLKIQLYYLSNSSNIHSKLYGKINVLNGELIPLLWAHQFYMNYRLNYANAS